MATKDPRIDAYIEESSDFAKPILTRLRALVHEGCPDVVETIKWGMPAFDYKGPFCGMAAFKKHCAFGFWKHELIFGDKGSAPAKAGAKLSWGVKGNDPDAARITSVKDLPGDKVFLRFIKEAVRLNDEGVKLPSRASRAGSSAAVELAKDFEAALKKSKKVVANFEALPPSHKREYIEWITEAKREETRRTRIATAVEWIGEGKSRNWKYQKKEAGRKLPKSADAGG